jgi:hypothetical protein
MQKHVPPERRASARPGFASEGNNHLPTRRAGLTTDQLCQARNIELEVEAFDASQSAFDVAGQ